MSESPSGFQPPKYPPRLYAWFVVGVLMLTSMVSYIDRQIVALLVEPIKADLGLTDTEVGWLYSGFALFFAIAGLPLAYLADRVNRVRLICVSLAIWSLMTVACSLARSYVPLLGARIGVGVGEAALTPAAHSLIGDYFPRAKIPMAIAVFQLSGMLGTGLAVFAGGLAVDWVTNMPPIDLAFIGVLRPWQAAFVVVGLPGLLVLLLLVAVREPLRRAPLGQRGTFSMDFRPVFAFYKSNWKSMSAHHAGFGALALSGYAIIFWAPTFFIRIHGSTPTQLAVGLGLAYFVGGTLGTYLGAWIGQRLYSKGHFDWPMRGTLMWAWLVIPLTWMVTTTDSVGLATGLFTLLVAAINLPFGLAFGALPIIAPPRLRGQVVAIYLIVGSAVGMGLGPVVLGAVNDNLFPEADGVRQSMMFVVTACAPLWLAFHWFGRGHYAASLRQAEAQAAHNEQASCAAEGC